MSSDDYFERAEKIHRGELDEEMPNYAELCQWLGRIPKTWLPGLLRRVVHHCVASKVFKEGGLESVVQNAKGVASEPHPYLREEATDVE